MANDHSVGMAVKQNPIGKYKLLAVGINDACNKNRAPGKSCVLLQLLFLKEVQKRSHKKWLSKKELTKHDFGKKFAILGISVHQGDRTISTHV